MIHRWITKFQQLYRKLPFYARVGSWIMTIWFLSFLLFLILHGLFPLPLPKSYSPTIMASDSTLLCAYLTEDDKWRMRTSLDQVSQDMIQAIIHKEDQWFYYHLGVNPFSVMRALIANTISGHRTSGASTITMQLARMADPAPRTYTAKFREMFRALQYEWKYSKREILEMYLSYLPYGGNVEGVSSASYIFFQRPPEKISLSQAILLSIIPNRPNSLRLDRNTEVATEARDKWIQRFGKMEIFGEEALIAAEREPVIASRNEVPTLTPHICYELKIRYSDVDEIYSTIRPETQNLVSQLLANHVQRVKRLDVTNGAVMVVDNQTHGVVAYCGSADFYDATSSGQVNGVTAVRSPGSALKPAAYALGFDLGIITPMSKMLDIPGNFQSFVPENYDLRFRGEVTVYEALTHSLNIPPVRLVQQIDNDRFLNLLESSGFETIRSRRHDLGLSAVLGGCGVTLEELTRFYGNFAAGGVQHRLKYLQQDLGDTTGQVTLFSPGTAWMVADILSGIERPDISQELLEDSKRPKVAWKTGTSYGKRDAWAVGITPRYTVGVWMGNFDGAGAPELSGSYMAVPLMMDLFNAIDYNPEQEWFARPAEVGERKVCSETGLLPGKYCHHYLTDDYLEGHSSLAACNLDQEIYINPDSTMQYCPVCLA